MLDVESPSRFNLFAERIQHLAKDSSNVDSIHNLTYQVCNYEIKNQNIELATLCLVGIDSML
jgi:hypothetical protein